jgi:hypothetical protein
MVCIASLRLLRIVILGLSSSFSSATAVDSSVGVSFFALLYSGDCCELRL